MILYYISLLLYRRLLDRFFGIRDSEFKSKIGTRFGIEIMFGRGMPKITLGITGLHKILGRDYGIEEPYWGPSYRYSIRLSRCDVLKKTCCFAANLSPFYNRGYPVWSPFIWRKLVPGGRVIRLPDPLSDGRANFSYNSLQNLASRLHENQKVVSARRMTRLARSRLFRW